jgi:uncharacterized protein YegL
VLKPELPGGAVANRDIHFMWLLDGSTSMAGEKVQSLNFAVADAIPEMRRAAAKSMNARVVVRALKFATDVEWVLPNGRFSANSPEPVPLTEFQWADYIRAGGETAMGQAFTCAAEEFEKLVGKGRFFPPVMILVTDGYATDDFEAGLKTLLNNPLGKAATRLAIGVGNEVDFQCLEKFIGNPEFSPLHASDAHKLPELIRWASVTGIARSSRPSSNVLPAPAGSQWITWDERQEKAR